MQGRFLSHLNKHTISICSVCIQSHLKRPIAYLTVTAEAVQFQQSYFSVCFVSSLLFNSCMVMKENTQEVKIVR